MNEGPPPNTQDFRIGLAKLKTGSILLIIATVVTIAGSAGMALSTPLLIGSVLGITPAVTLITLSAAIVAIIGIVLGLIGIYIYVVPAYSRLRNFDEERFGTASTLVKIGLLGGLISFLIALALLLVAVSAAASGGASVAMGLGLLSIGLFILAVILLIIGKAGIAVGSFKLSSVVSETLFIIAGAFFVVSLILDIVGAVFKPVILASSAAELVAWIFTYAACSSALKKVIFLK